MVSPPVSRVVVCSVADLDVFAAALADLASAIARRDGAAALDDLERVTATDPATGDALADFLSFMGMFEEVTS